MKKRSERCKHCVLDVVRWSQNFRPAADSLPGVQDRQNLISWRWSLPSTRDPVWWRSMHAILSYRGNRPTNKPPHTHTHPQTGPITIHCAAASAQCNNQTISDRIDFFPAKHIYKQGKFYLFYWCDGPGVGSDCWCSLSRLTAAALYYWLLTKSCIKISF